MYLHKLDETGYRDYQRSMRKIQYSMARKGESTEQEHLIFENMKDAIIPKPEFIDMVKKPNYAVYCLKDDNGNNIGITTMAFKNKTCVIGEFAVFEKLQGTGTMFFKMLLEEIIKPRGCKEIKLACPWEGAQVFWEKLKFHRVWGNKSFSNRVWPEYMLKVKY